MNKTQTWREILRRSIADTQERERIAGALGINPITLVRWVNGESQPRLQNLRKLPTILPQHSETLRRSIEEEFGNLSPAREGESMPNAPSTIPTELYMRVLHTLSVVPRQLRYPNRDVVGVDISQAMIQYAQTTAHLRGLNNTHFRVMDITQPLDFPDNSFDLVNGRMIGFLHTESWVKLMEETIRITRPGGIIRLTEFESPGTTNSAALEQVIELLAQALKVAGQNFSPGGRRIGITPMLRRCLQNAGCSKIQQVAHIIDYSTGTEVHEGFRADWTSAFKLLEPFLLGTGVTTQEEFDRLYEQMQVEMLSDDFCAVMFLLTAWGEKP